MTAQQDVEFIARPALSLVRHVAAVLRSETRSLLLTEILYRLLAAALLAPFVGLAVDQLVQLSGEPALTGEDLAASLMSPRGLLVVLAVLAIGITVRTLDCAALMCIVLGADQGYRIAPSAALLFTLRRSWRIVYVTAKHLAIALPPAALIAAVAYGFYRLLLGRHDINYYLTEKPPAFWIAVIIGGVLLGGALAAALPILRSWIDMLPRAVFSGRFGPRSVRLKVTDRGAAELLVCVALWAAVNFLLTISAGALVAWSGRSLVQAASAYPILIVPSVAVTWLLLGAVNFATSFLATASLATILAERFMRTRTPDQCLKHLGELRPPPVMRPMSDWLLRHKYRLLALGLVVLVIVITGQLTTPVPDRFPEIIAHRGASLDFPENTLAAIQGAIDAGADWAEIDVQETADGTVVVVHDSDFKKIAGSTLRVWEASMDDLRDLDVGSWFDPRFADQRVPTLQEVLELCRGRIGVMIELKSYGRGGRLEERVIELVEAAEMQNQVALMSLRLETLRRLRSLRPTWTVGLVVPLAVGNPALIDADFLAIHSGRARRATIRAAQVRGRKLYVWTVNDTLQMSRLIDAGVDGIITDDPALMRDLIRRRSEMTVWELLLLRTATLLGADLPP